MSAAVWAVGGAASLAVHAMLAGVLAIAVQPKPVEPQDALESRLVLAAYEVRQTDAIAAAAGGAALPPGRAEAAALSQDTIPRVAALAQAPQSSPAPARAPDAPRLAVAEPGAVPALAPAARQSATLAAEPTTSAPIAASTGAPVALPTAAVQAVPTDGIAPVAVALDAAAAEAEPATAVAGTGQDTPAADPPAPLLDVVAQTAVAVAALPPGSGPAVEATPPDAARSNSVAPVAAGVVGTAPDAPQVASLAAPSALAHQAAPRSDAVPPATPASERMMAALAWSGDNQAAVDPVSLAAIQSFMTESDLGASRLDAGSVRDGIAGLLAQVPCSRLQAAFIPETGSLELRGHVPEEGLRAPVLAALRAQVGGSIPVRDNVLVLPRPQCGALSGIASLGLPQSTDQETNPRLVGKDAHARVYRYGEGERMVLDLVAPDYDAHVYVDYFDADGNVIHLVPNEHVELERHGAKEGFAVGADRPDGNFLAITVAPPFGQEIATAFAASVPLYDGVRPTVEPAGPYLDWLRERVGAARAADPGFKGEWVYFFVATSAKE